MHHERKLQNIRVCDAAVHTLSQHHHTCTHLTSALPTLSVLVVAAADQCQSPNMFLFVSVNVVCLTQRDSQNCAQTGSQHLNLEDVELYQQVGTQMSHNDLLRSSFSTEGLRGGPGSQHKHVEVKSKIFYYPSICLKAQPEFLLQDTSHTINIIIVTICIDDFCSAVSQ